MVSINRDGIGNGNKPEYHYRYRIFNLELEFRRLIEIILWKQQIGILTTQYALHSADCRVFQIQPWYIYRLYLKSFYGIPATRTSSERSFSLAGRTLEERRSQLDPDTVDDLMFIHGLHLSLEVDTVTVAAVVL